MHAGGMLLGQKVSERVAATRTLPAGIDQRSASRHPDWTGPDDLVIKINELREITDWEKPIYVKVGAPDAAGRVPGDQMVQARWDLIERGRYMWASVQTVRGCPKHCSFCSVWRTDGQKPRQRTVDRVLAEIVAFLKAEGDAFASYLEGLPESFLAEPVAMPPGAQPATDRHAGKPLLRQGAHLPVTLDGLLGICAVPVSAEHVGRPGGLEVP